MSVKRLGSTAVPAPLILYGSPKEAHEWRLVTVRGRIDSVRKLGDRWRAELVVGGDRVVVTGQSGAGIPVASVPTGRLATVTGIVRRPYPSATDRRFAILPRSRADLRVDPGSSPGSGGGAKTGGGTGSGTSGPGSAAGSAATGSPIAAPDANLVDLPTLAGRTVRVGGLVTTLLTGGFTLDDGTATGPVALQGEAADLLPLIAPGDAINVVGRIESTDRGWTVVVTDPAGVLLAGDTVAADPTSGMAAVDPGTSPGASAPAGVHSAGLSPFGDLDAGLAGLGTLAALTAASRGRDPPPTTASPAPGDGPDGRPTGRRRRRNRRPSAAPIRTSRRRLPGARSGPASPSTIHARRTRLDARESAGLSSPEFRACGTAN